MHGFKILFSFVLAASLVLLPVQYVYAEEAPEEIIPAAPEETPSVPVTLDNEALAAAIADALKGDPEEVDDAASEPAAPASDYTGQLFQIQATLDQIEENTRPATDETAVSAFDIPFDSYTPTEVMVLLILSVLAVYLIFKMFIGG